MSGTNIITANFARNKRQSITRKLYQGDYGQILRLKGLELPETFQVHFSNDKTSGTAKKVIGTHNDVNIPDEYFSSGKNIYIWVFLHQTETDGETRYFITIPITVKPEANDELPLQIQHQINQNVIDEINNIIDQNDVDYSNGYNTVTANFIHESKQTITRKLYQGDYGQKLKIKGLKLPKVFEAHFSNSKIEGTAKIVIGEDYEIEIPDEYLLSGQDIYAWIFLHESAVDGETRHCITIPVIQKPKVINSQPTPAQQDLIQEAIAVLNNTIKETEENVKHYPKIVSGYWFVYNAQTDEYVNTYVDAHGLKGDTGNGISSAILNNDDTLTLTFTNGQTYTTPSIKGRTPNITTNREENVTNIYTDGQLIGTIQDGNSPTAIVSKNEMTGISNFSVTDNNGNTNTEIKDGLNFAWNLLKHTNDLLNDDFYYYNINFQASNNEFLIFATRTADVVYKTGIKYSELQLQQYPTYTFSFEAKQLESFSLVSDYLSIGYGFWANHDSDSFDVNYDRYGFQRIQNFDSNWKKYFITFTIPEDLTRGNIDALTNESELRFSFYRNRNSKQIKIRNMKLEPGFIATPWTPNYQDIYGKKGQSGITPSLSIGIVQTLDPDQPATATITGTAENPVLNLGIPQGEDGEIPDTQHFVRDTDIANDSQTYGIVRAPFTNGVGVDINGDLQIVSATFAEIKAGGNAQKPVTPIRQHESTFYGLAKAAGVDEKTSQNQVGTYTDNAKTAIRNMLGVGIANTSTAGLVKDGQSGITVDTDGSLILDYADATKTLSGVTRYAAVVPRFQHYSAFYGLAKAAGVDEKDNVDGIGTYSNEAKAAIQNMLDVPSKADVAAIQTMSIHICTAQEYDSTTRVPTIQSPDAKTFYLVPTADGSSPDLFTEWVYVNNAWEMFGSASIDLSGYLTDMTVNGTSVVQNGVAKIPVASANDLGAVKVNLNSGIRIDSTGTIALTQSSTDQIKAGTNSVYAVRISKQHESTFYGLAKAAGDTTQSASSNAVGTYTDEAKTSIKNMLGVEDPTVDDVTINGTSIVNNGVAEIPIADSTNPGMIIIDSYGGLQVGSNNKIKTNPAAPSHIKAGTNTNYPLTPSTQHESTFYGLAKAAGDSTQSASDNAIGTYTDDAKSAIRTMLGVPSEDDVVGDVQINGTSIVNNGVAEIPVASSNTAGVVKTSNSIGITQDGAIGVIPSTTAMIKEGINNQQGITPGRQHGSVFYGLAKAAGDTTQAQSNNAIGTYTDEAKSAIRNMLDVPASSDIPEIPVTDVQINSASILDNSIANIPIASTNQYGVIKADPMLGVYVDDGYLKIQRAVAAALKAGTDQYRPIVPQTQHWATFYGLAKAAGDTSQSQSSNTVGTYTDEAKSAIQSMLGVPSEDDVVNDVQINGSSIVTDRVAEIPIASTRGLGLVKPNSMGVYVNGAGEMSITKATSAQLKAGTGSYNAIVPVIQHESTFYALAKAAGDTTQSQSNNAIGTYTDEAKSAIRTMLGAAGTGDIPNVPVTDVQVNGTSILSNGTANIPVADDRNLGLSKINPSYGIGIINDYLIINGASSTDIKNGANSTKAVSSYRQHESVFYGLAKAAGDATQSQSNNAVGTYTTQAKSAIKSMLDIPSVDSTLSIQGAAADAKAIGDAFNLHFTGFVKDENDSLCFSSYLLSPAQNEEF